MGKRGLAEWRRVSPLPTQAPSLPRRVVEVCLPLCSSEGQDVERGAQRSHSTFHSTEAEDREGVRCFLGPELDCPLQGIMGPQGHFTVPIPTQPYRVACAVEMLLGSGHTSLGLDPSSTNSHVSLGRHLISEPQFLFL